MLRSYGTIKAYNDDDDQGQVQKIQKEGAKTPPPLPPSLLLPPYSPLRMKTSLFTTCSNKVTLTTYMYDDDAQICFCLISCYLAFGIPFQLKLIFAFIFIAILIVIIGKLS